MTKPSKAAAALKAMRARTKLTVQEVADGLKKPKSSYAAYEDKYKKEYLPVELVKALIPIFRPHGVDSSELLALAGVADAFEERGHPSAELTSGMAQIEELDATPAAGAGADVSELEVVRVWQIPENVVSVATESPLSKIKIVRVKGDSMQPTFNPVDRAMVDTGDTLPSPGGVFVVWDGLGFVLKRIQLVPQSDPPRVRLSSDNVLYDPYERTLDEAYIQGRVIGKWLWT